MNKELKIYKEKDDILRMAKDRTTIQMSEYADNDYRRIVGIVYELKAQGYINISDTTGSISVWITHTGNLFLENGGYEGSFKDSRNDKRKAFLNPILVNIASKIIIGVGCLIIGYYIPRKQPNDSPRDAINQIQNVQHLDSSIIISIPDSIPLKCR